jgi:hypothetical protein
MSTPQQNPELLANTQHYGVLEVRRYSSPERIDVKRDYYVFLETTSKTPAIYPIEYPLLRACKENARNNALPYNHPSRTDAQDVRFSDQYYVSGTMEIRSRPEDGVPILYIYEDTAIDIRVPLRLTANMQNWGIGPFYDYQKCLNCIEFGSFRGVFVSLCMNCARTCKYVYGFGVEIKDGKIVDTSSDSCNVEGVELNKMIADKEIHSKLFNAECPQMIEYIYMEPNRFRNESTIYGKFNTKLFGARHTYLAGVDESQIGYSDTVSDCSVFSPSYL